VLKVLGLIKPSRDFSLSFNYQSDFETKISITDELNLIVYYLHIIAKAINGSVLRSNIKIETIILLGMNTIV
jgi:hypothetical protein